MSPDGRYIYVGANNYGVENLNVWRLDLGAEWWKEFEPQPPLTIEERVSQLEKGQEDLATDVMMLQDDVRSLMLK